MAFGMATLNCWAETAKQSRGFFNHKEHREHREKAENLNREPHEIRQGLKGKPVNYGEFAIIKSRAGLNSYRNVALPQPGRRQRLNQIAIRQMQTLATSRALQQIEPPKGPKE